MPLRTMSEQEVLLELAAAASVKVQAEEPLLPEVLVAAVEVDAALAVVLAVVEAALAVLVALVEAVALVVVDFLVEEDLAVEVAAAALAVVLVVLVLDFLVEVDDLAARAAASTAVVLSLAAEETDLQPGAAVTRALEPRRAITAAARILDLLEDECGGVYKK